MNVALSFRKTGVTGFSVFLIVSENYGVLWFKPENRSFEPLSTLGLNFMACTARPRLEVEFTALATGQKPVAVASGLRVFELPLKAEADGVFLRNRRGDNFHRGIFHTFGENVIAGWKQGKTIRVDSCEGTKSHHCTNCLLTVVGCSVGTEKHVCNICDKDSALFRQKLRQILHCGIAAKTFA